MRAYPLTSEELVDDLLAQIDEVTAAVRERFGALSHEQLAWRPRPERWGVGHCLVHLARTSELYRGPLAEALRAARSEGKTARGPLKGGLFGRWFTRAMAPGGGLKVKTKDPLRPRYVTIQEGGLEMFFAEQARFRDAVGEARGLDLDAVRIVSPVSSIVRLCAGDALRALVAHEWRHLAQAERVLASEGFPR